MIVTQNTRHFPNKALAPLGIEAVEPDLFLCNLLDLDKPAIYGCLMKVAACDAQKTGGSPVEAMNVLLDALKRDAKDFASRVSEFLGTECLP